jgi:hypothetical protein
VLRPDPERWSGAIECAEVIGDRLTCRLGGELINLGKVRVEAKAITPLLAQDRLRRPERKFLVSQVSLVASGVCLEGRNRNERTVFEGTDFAGENVDIKNVPPRRVGHGPQTLPPTLIMPNSCLDEAAASLRPTAPVLTVYLLLHLVALALLGSRVKAVRHLLAALCLNFVGTYWRKPGLPRLRRVCRREEGPGI